MVYLERETGLAPASLGDKMAGFPGDDPLGTGPEVRGPDVTQLIECARRSRPLGSLCCRGFLLFEPKLGLADLVDKLSMTNRSHDP